MREDVLNGYEIGADDYVLKPFDSEVLLYKIKAVFQRNSGEEEKFEQEDFKIGKFAVQCKIETINLRW